MVAQQVSVHSPVVGNSIPFMGGLGFELTTFKEDFEKFCQEKESVALDPLIVSAMRILVQRIGDGFTFSILPEQNAFLACCDWIGQVVHKEKPRKLLAKDRECILNLVRLGPSPANAGIKSGIKSLEKYRKLSEAIKI